MDLHDMLKVFIVSAMPLSELRGGLPLALHYGFSPLEAYVLCVLSNAFPVPFILMLLGKVEKIMGRYETTSKIFNFFLRRGEKKKDVVERYGYAGLTLFVAIPLPVTGAWTGSLIAFILGLKPLKSFAYIFIGILIAGVVVLALSMGVISIAYGIW
ncbi:putative membrane protein [Archaeoglobus sulfaticallidus PM70-1]|uniref:Putative membrane protein n=1 Tax=Archaeoglobus sulfaticallidus PM70-1 TaxID=387631 RepID=N0BKS2_9EURY|nr:small multi-drug export protein [Archaeoglobus sulfaticallidus]AGK61116.1 putative membrane protein [Archaeoglobus sulfaticallidus PM70-1]